MTRVGLVLGAGGVVGQAYHAGVLAVLEHDCGFDAREADMIVGTSAGSVTGTLLRLGVSSGDLAAWTVKAPLSGTDTFARPMAQMPHPVIKPAYPDYDKMRSLVEDSLHPPAPGSSSGPAPTASTGADGTTSGGTAAG